MAPERYSEIGQGKGHMNERLFEPHRYEADTPEAVLQCAVAVACIDGEFASDERERVRKVYADICREMTYAYNAPDVSDEYEYIAESTADVALALDDRELKLAYIDYRADLITDADLQELTLIMSLRIAGADAELAATESVALRHLADSWEISLSDVLAPYV